MTLSIELVVSVLVIFMIPAFVRFSYRLGKGQKTGAMMAIGFVFANLFEAKPPQRTEEVVKGETKNINKTSDEEIC